MSRYSFSSVLIVLLVVGFCGCGTVEVAVERYAPPVWDVEGLNRLKIAPMVGFGETHRGLALDLAYNIASFLKESATYQAIDVIPFSSSSPIRGKDGETILAPNDALQLLKDADAVLTVQVLSFSCRVEMSRIRMGVGVGYGAPEWSVTGMSILDDFSLVKSSAVVAFGLYCMPDGALKERLICAPTVKLSYSEYVYDRGRGGYEIFDMVSNEILCHLHIHRSVVKRKFMESHLREVSYAADAVLCGNLDKAEEVLADGINRHPDVLELVYDYAVVLEAKRRYQEALKFYKRAQELAGAGSFASEIEDVERSITAWKFYNQRKSVVTPSQPAHPPTPQPEPKK